MSKADTFTTRVSVCVVMRNPHGELLLQQRANTGFLDGYYDFACNGHVENGESLQDTAIRELKEEIGVDAVADDLQLIHIGQNDLDTPYMNFTFVLKRWKGEPTICEPEKCSDLAYFAPDKLPDMCTLIVRVNEMNHFALPLSYSRVTTANYADYMGRPYVG